MKILWCSLFLVILWFDKLKSSPLPFEKVKNDSNYDASPWSPDEVRPSDYLGGTTSMEFEQVNDGGDRSSTDRYVDNLDGDDEVQVKISRNVTRKVETSQGDENENSPFSHNPKSSQSKSKRDVISKETVPAYSQSYPETDPETVFLIRTKRTSTDAPKAHFLTKAPPQDKIIEDNDPGPISMYRKKHDKNDDQDTTTHKIVDTTIESGTLVVSKEESSTFETTEKLTTMVAPSSDTKLEEETATTAIPKSRVTTKDVQETTESKLDVGSTSSTINMKSSVSSDVPTPMATSDDSSVSETTKKTTTRMIRSTDQVTTVRDVLTTEKTSGITTEEDSTTNDSTNNDGTTVTEVRSFTSTMKPSLHHDHSIMPIPDTSGGVGSILTTTEHIPTIKSSDLSNETTNTSFDEAITEGLMTEVRSALETTTEYDSSTRPTSTITLEDDPQLTTVFHTITPLTTIHSVVETTNIEKDETATKMTTQDQIITSTMLISVEEGTSNKQSEPKEATIPTFTTTPPTMVTNSGHEIMPLTDDSNIGSTNMLTGEPLVTEATPKKTTWTMFKPTTESPTTVTPIMTNKVTTEATVPTSTEGLVSTTLLDKTSTFTSLTHDDVTDSGLHQESSGTNKRSINGIDETETSTMTKMTETGTFAHTASLKEFTTASSLKVTNTGHDIRPLTEDDTKVQSTYMLTAELGSTDGTTQMTTLVITEPTTTESITGVSDGLTTVTPVSTTKDTTPKGTFTTFGSTSSSPVNHRDSESSDHKIMPLPEVDTKVRTTYILTPEPISTVEATKITTVPITSTEAVGTTTFPKSTAIPLTHHDVTDTDLHEESSGTDKRSIDGIDKTAHTASSKESTSPEFTTASSVKVTNAGHEIMPLTADDTKVRTTYMLTAEPGSTDGTTKMTTLVMTEPTTVSIKETTVTPVSSTKATTLSMKISTMESTSSSPVDTKVRTTYILTPEPISTAETTKITTLPTTTKDAAGTTTFPKSISTPLTHHDVTDSGHHEESSAVDRRSIADLDEPKTSTMTKMTETGTFTHTASLKESTTSEFTSASSAKVTSAGHEIMPLTENDSKVRSTYMLTAEPGSTDGTTKMTTLVMTKPTTEFIKETTVTPISTTKVTTPEATSTSSMKISTMDSTSSSTVDQGDSGPSDHKIMPLSDNDIKEWRAYLSTAKPIAAATETTKITALPTITKDAVDTTAFPKSISTPLTHHDVTDSGHHEESSGANKRSIDKTDANDLTSSSSAVHEASDRSSSTEKIAKTTAKIQPLVSTDEVLTNTLKDVETTLETPIVTEPKPVRTTNAHDEALTTHKIATTTQEALSSNKLTSTEDLSTIKLETTTIPTTTANVPATEKQTTKQSSSITTQTSTIPTSTETATILSGSVYGTNTKSKDDAQGSTMEDMGTPTTPKGVAETTTESPQSNPSSSDTNVQCNTAPVYSKGDTIVGGGAINDINVHEKDHKDKKGNHSEKIELCTSTECVHSASRMLSRMNLKVDPCNDFYEFACGTFLAETHVPSEKSNVDIFSTINDKLQQQIQVLLSEPIDKDKDIMPVRVVKTLFSACMNRDLIEKRGVKPLMDLLHLLGGWPILIGDSWSGEHWTWSYTVARMKLLGVGIDYIIELSVTNDFANSSKRIVYLDQAATELDREFLMNGWNDTNVQAYFEYIKDIAIALGADKEVADREAREIVNFEISLGHISASKESRRELHSLYNPITIRDLQHQHPYLNWLEYINLLLPHKARVTNDQIISLADKTFIKKLGPLLDNTPKRVLANYLLWHAVDQSISYLTESLQKIELRYRSKTNGKDELDPQWKECVISIAPQFKVAIGAKYAREYFREDSKKVAVEMVTDIKEAFAEIIESRDWMDEDTKTAAMDKLQRMSVNIAYPNELMNDHIVTEYYKGLHVKEDEYFESQLSSYAFLMDKGLDRLHDPVNKTDWRDLSYVAVVNAFYHPLLNYIMFPAGILQEHFFQADRPKYMNYAAIGFVIGHEITHGFDDMGAQFDVEGNLRQWWQNETLEAYATRAQCIIDQYGNFTDPEVNATLNGFTTQGENIADNGGLKEAYIAYQKWVQKYGEEAGLPGLNYTSNQLFWISAAQTWCTKYKPEALKYTIVTDSHSPGRFRVMGPFMNSVTFANDFECQKNSPMNPETKCEVW